MSLPSTPRPSGEPISVDDETCRIKHVVPTSTVFTAALEHLNRQSTMALFQALAQELDDHGQKLNRVGSGTAAHVEDLRAELLGLLALLRQTTEQHRQEVTQVTDQLTELSTLNAQMQDDFARQMSALIKLQIEQHLAPAVATASVRIEQNVSALFERELKPLSARISEAIEKRQGSRIWGLILWVLLALLLSGAFFALGLFTGNRSAAAACAKAGLAGACAAAMNGAAPAAMMLPPHPATAVESKRQPFVMAMTGAPIADRAMLETTPAAPPLTLSGFELRPNSMEAELLEFLTRPGSHAPHTFTMDRLKYPTRSHEVNPDGKEQVYLLAKILLAHPKVRIEIRGHNDGTESEVYTGPNPIVGYTLSQLRANCVLRRLTALNVPADHLRLRGMGSSQPVATDRTEEGRQYNRRVEIVVLPR